MRVVRAVTANNTGAPGSLTVIRKTRMLQAAKQTESIDEFKNLTADELLQKVADLKVEKDVVKIAMEHLEALGSTWSALAVHGRWHLECAGGAWRGNRQH